RTIRQKRSGWRERTQCSRCKSPPRRDSAALAAAHYAWSIAECPRLIAGRKKKLTTRSSESFWKEERCSRRDCDTPYTTPSRALQLRCRFCTHNRRRDR
ncbi:hypothetical protein PFISCL1PPCAC_21496, partial [Pristionchus fissidentatus]